MNLKQKLKKFFTSLVAISMVATAIVPTTTMAVEMPIVPDEYTVTLSQSDGGDLVFAGTNTIKDKFSEGDTVEMDLRADDGYQASEITVVYDEDGQVAAEADATGHTAYSFTMPAENVTVSVSWEVVQVEGEEESLGNTHLVRIEETEGGSLVFKDGKTGSEEFRAGEVVQIAISNETESPVLSLNTETASGNDVEVECNEQNVFSFVMPDEDVNLSVVFYGVSDEFATYLNSLQDREEKIASIPAPLATSDTTQYVVGDWIDYGDNGIGSFDWGTMYRYTDGNMAYCVQPALYDPGNGTYTKHYDVENYIQVDYTDAATQVERIRAVLYISPGCPGYSEYKSYWPSKWVNGNDVTQDQTVINAHILLSHAYDTTSMNGSETFADLTQTYKNYYYRYVLGSYEGDTYSDATWYKVTNGLDNGTLIIPNSFKIFVLHTSGYQDILGWEYEPYGYLTLYKQSDSTTVTNNNSQYDLAGAQYTVYTDSSCSTVAKDANGSNAVLTTKSDGTTNTLELDQGDYWVKETKAATGYSLDSTAYPVTITSNNTETSPYTLNVKDTPITTYVTLTKSSANTTITSGNDCYDLAGAQYTLYTDSGCSTVAKTASGNNAVLTVKSDGTTNTLEMPLGTYYVKETTAGIGYSLDSTVHSVTLTSSNTSSNPAVVNCTDVPQSDPISLLLQKVDAQSNKTTPEGSASFEGATYTVKYYDAYYDKASDVESSHLKNTWVFATDEDGYFNLSSNYLVSGDSLYTDSSGTPTMPLGTVTIQETSAPEGYNMDSTVYVRQITGNGTSESVYTYNEVTSPEPVYREDFKFVKQDGDTQQPMGNVLFSVTSKTTGETHYIWTDENGQYDSSSEFAKHSTNTNAGTSSYDGLWFYGYADANEYGTSPDLGDIDDDLGALPYDTYTLQELPCDANKGYTLITVDFEINRDGWTADLGTEEDFIFGFSTYATNFEGNVKYIDNNEFVGITDTITYWGYSPDTEYTFTTKLYDLTTGKFINNSSGGDSWSATITPSTKNGSFDMQITFDGTELEDHTLVVYEYVYDENGLLLDSEEDPTNEDQMVYFPKIGTTLTDADVSTDDEGNRVVTSNGNHVLDVADEVTLIDTVEYSNLPVDTWITMSGTLYDKDTGDVLRDANGVEVTGSTRWYNTSSSGTVDVTFTFNASLLGGDSIVASEDVIISSITVGHHFDWDDEGQTVKFNPHIYTAASDANTGLQYVDVTGETTITDAIEYHGLDPEDTYTFTSKMYDLTTGDFVKDSSGKDMSFSTKFSSESRHGETEVSFTFDATGLEGHTIVVFEYIYDSNGDLYVSETDETYEEQMIYFPEMGTLLVNDDGEQYRIAYGEKIRLTDTVEYNNIPVNTDVTMSGILYDYDTGEPLLDDQGHEITSSVTWHNLESSGSVDIVFDFDAATLAGRTVVCSEELIMRGVVIGHHFDWNDTYETIVFDSDISTAAVGEGAESSYLDINGDVTLIDSVTYHGLNPAKTYKFTTKLYDLMTGDFVKNSSGTDLSFSTNIQPDEWYGVENIRFTFDAEGLQGHTIVIYEYIYDSDGNLFVSETDPDDEDQTIYFPYIGTELVDDNGEHYNVEYGEKIRLTDTVEYSNIPTGVQATMIGTLYDVSTGEPLLDDEGHIVTAEKSWYNRNTSGTVEVVFDFDASLLAGRKVVAAEELSVWGLTIGHHFDWDDTFQTVVFKSLIETAATNADTGLQYIDINGDVSIIDAVTYYGLDPEETYKFTTKLYDLDTDDFVKSSNGSDRSFSTNIQPDDWNGTKNIRFTFDATGMEGHTIVIYEYVYDSDGNLFVSEEDKTDENQMIYFPEIGTELTDDNDSHEGIAFDENLRLTDTVKYNNIPVGVEVTMSGMLYDTSTGEPLLDDEGHPVTAEKTWHNLTSSGTVDIVFDFDASLLAGRTVVAAEELIFDGITIGHHFDWDDTFQTVVFKSLIETAASEADTGLQYIDINGDVSIIDAVTYYGLDPEETYKFTTKLYDLTTGDFVKSSNGSDRSFTAEFSPDDWNGTKDIRFTFDATGMEGHTIVIYEYVYDSDGNLFVSEEDKTDENQMIYFPEIGTELTDDNDSHEGIAYEENLRLTDTVKYNNIPVGVEVTMSGTLYDTSTGEPLLDDEGHLVTAEKTWYNLTPSGTVDIIFDFDASLLAGRTVVAAEELIFDGITVGHHFDWDDEPQTVVFDWQIHTKATDADTGFQYIDYNNPAHVKDAVTFEGLHPGETYTFVTELYDLTEGDFVRSHIVDIDEVVEDESDDSVTDEDFVDSETDYSEIDKDDYEDYGVSELAVQAFIMTAFTGDEFTIYPDASSFDSIEADEGLVFVSNEDGAYTFVANESGEHLVSFTIGNANYDYIISVRDIPEEFDDTFYIEPDELVSLDTTDVGLITVSNGLSQIVDEDDPDMVSFTASDVGVYYIAFDYNDGTEAFYVVYVEEPEEEPEEDYLVVVNEFTPDDWYGEVDIDFTFDASGLEGHTVVLIEYVFGEDGELYVSEVDLEAEEQMLYFPYIGTELVDENYDHETIIDDAVTFTDTVNYDNMPVDTYLTMTGTLYDKITGEPLIDADGNLVTAEKTWYNHEPSGVVEIEFTFNASLLAGHTIVAAEEASIEGITVGYHFDWEDTPQTVWFPKVGTTLVNDWTGEHQATIFENHTISLTDTVAYENLIPGETYTLVGVLMDTETNAYVLNHEGEDVWAELMFTPDEPDGTVDMTFEFDANGLHDTYVVAFEYLYDELGNLVGSHEDIDDEEQTVQLLLPTVWTYAAEMATGKKSIEPTDDVIVVDMLDATDLIVGHTYYVYGKAVDKETGELIYGHDGEPLELYNMFIADSDEMMLDIMQFEFDATDLIGKEIVFEEYLYADEDRTILITEEEDLGSAEQTVFFLNNIDIGTVLLDDENETHVAYADNHVSLTDTVEYSGAKVGETYTMSGTLIDRETGMAVVDKDGNEVTATSAPFVAEASDGVVEITFEFEAEDIGDDEVVAYERLYNSEGTLVGAHEDINDESQSVTFPVIGTTLLDVETSSHSAVADGNTVLTDYVYYEGLLPDTEYTITGILMNKATGEKLLDSDGYAITSETIFTTPSIGELSSYTIESTEEDTSSDDSALTFDAFAGHIDEKDMPDTIVVSWGSEFTVNVRDDADVSSITYGKGDSSEIEFIGSDRLVYRFCGGIGTALVGSNDTVDRLTIGYSDGETDDYLVIIVTSEEAVDNMHWTIGDIDPEDFMDIPYSSATILNEDEKGNYAEFKVRNADKISVDFPELDDIEYYIGFNDIGYLKFYEPGVYTVKFSEGLDEWYGLYIVDSATDYSITVPEPDTEPDTSIPNPVLADDMTVSGYAEVTFTFDATGMDGIYAVAYEYLYDTDENLIADHEDIDDEAQTVELVEVAIGTQLVDTDTNSHYTVADGDVELVDHVKYDGLTVGSEYTLVGVLMDKDTGEVAVDDHGNEIYSWETFTAESVSGEEDMDFSFDGVNFNGRAVVAYEYLFDEHDRFIAEHTDIEDDSQTVWFLSPSIETQLVDADTSSHYVVANEDVELVDHVKYEGLNAGSEYTLVGVLMDKDTGEVVVDAHGDEIYTWKTFTAQSESGEEDMNFSFDGVNFEGRAAVAFEYLFDSYDSFIAEHTDIEDDSQTAWFLTPSIGTTLLDKESGTHQTTAEGRVTLVDNVRYEDFAKGETYTVKGVLMDRSTETYLLDSNGNRITSSGAFTADATSGITNVVFTFDADDLGGSFAVAYEYVYDSDGILIASHEDISDEAQTVQLVKPEVVPENVDNPENPTATTYESPTTSTVITTTGQEDVPNDEIGTSGKKTGDNMMRNVIIAVIVCGAAGCVICVSLIRRKNRRNNIAGGSTGLG